MEKVSRREFIVGGTAAVAVSCTCLGGVSGCSMAVFRSKAVKLPADAYSKSDSGSLEIDLAQAEGLKEIGGAIKIVDRNLPDSLIIVRKSENEYIAASLLCTHGKQEINYNSEEQKFICASVGKSEFGMDGSLLKGPAKKPIPAYNTKVEDGKLIVVM